MKQISYDVIHPGTAVPLNWVKHALPVISLLMLLGKRWHVLPELVGPSSSYPRNYHTGLGPSSPGTTWEMLLSKQGKPGRCSQGSRGPILCRNYQGVQDWVPKAAGKHRELWALFHHKANRYLPQWIGINYYYLLSHPHVWAFVAQQNVWTSICFWFVPLYIF